jgi:outer membrane lipoprotein-sorting protein
MILVLILSLVFAQSPAPSATVDEKSQQIIDRAIEALGGQKYLNIQTVTGKGFYTTYRDNISQIPARFLDYIEYPNRERTEFVGSGIRTIQTNDGDTGWFFDGAVKKISDQTPAQVDSFKQQMKTGVEYLLRGWWKKEGGKITYVGRREAGLAKRNEAIRTRKDPDSGDQVESTEEDRLLTFITVDGVTTPWIVDRYVDGKQYHRINYESVQYNQKFPENLFSKPADIKTIK